MFFAGRQVHDHPYSSDDSLSSGDDFANFGDLAGGGGGRGVPRQHSSRSRLMMMGRTMADMFDEALGSSTSTVTRPVGAGAAQEEDGATEKPKRGRPRGCKPEPHGADEESEHKLKRWTRDPTTTQYWQLLKDSRIADPTSYEGNKFRHHLEHHPGVDTNATCVTLNCSRGAAGSTSG